MDQMTQEQPNTNEGTVVTQEAPVTPHHHVTHHHTSPKKGLTTPVAIIIAACILGASHIVYGALIGQKNRTPVNLFQGPAITEKDYPTGNTKSDVVVVEYSDPECPFCARLHPTMKQLEEEYAKKVSFVYRHFPLTQIHKNAFSEAQAIDCIGKELGADKRRDYIDALFSYKIKNNSMQLPVGKKEELAKNMGSNETKFLACLSQEESASAVNASIQGGVNAGVSGTPATFILKKDGDSYEVVSLIEGARDYDYIKMALEAALK